MGRHKAGVDDYRKRQAGVNNCKQGQMAAVVKLKAVGRDRQQAEVNNCMRGR